MFDLNNTCHIEDSLLQMDRYESAVQYFNIH
jgi:hypothetical protein